MEFSVARNQSLLFNIINNGDGDGDDEFAAAYISTVMMHIMSACTLPDSAEVA